MGRTDILTLVKLNMGRTDILTLVKLNIPSGGGIQVWQDLPAGQGPHDLDPRVFTQSTLGVNEHPPLFSAHSLMSEQEKPFPTNAERHCPYWNVPGRLIHWNGGSAEQVFGLSVHSSTSTVQAGSDRDLAHPASKIQVVLIVTQPTQHHKYRCTLAVKTYHIKLCSVNISKQNITQSNFNHRKGPKYRTFFYIS